MAGLSPMLDTNPAGFSMPFGEHLEDLRRRLTFGLLGVIPIFIVALIFGDQILALLLEPLRHELTSAGLPPYLQATGPIETFATYFRIAMIMTILAGSPWILYQAWLFVAPGLFERERRFVHLLVPMSALLTVTGTVFLYFVMFPVMLNFFITFSMNIGEQAATTAPVPVGTLVGDVTMLSEDPPEPMAGQIWINTQRKELRVAIPVGNGGESGDRGGGGEVRRVEVLGVPLTRSTGIVQQYRVSEYVKLFLSLALAFAIGFQMPVVVLLLGWAGIVERKTLTKYRRYVVLGCAVAAAFLTPADPVSMLLLAGPLYVLFELGQILLLLLPADRVARGVFWQNNNDDDGEAQV